MLTLRLFRVGKKNQPSFKIVVTDKRNPPRAGRFTEEVGFYNPLTKEKVIRKERVQYWLSQGVQPSPTVFNLLVKEGILTGKKIAVHKKSKKPVAAVPLVPTAAAPAAATPALAPVETSAPVEKTSTPVEVPAPEPPQEAPKTE